MPGAPSAPPVTGTTTSSISLAWSAASGTVTGYRVYEGTTVRATVTGTSRHHQRARARTRTHTYTVAAYNTVGEGPRSAAVDRHDQRHAPTRPAGCPGTR